MFKMFIVNSRCSGRSHARLWPTQRPSQVTFPVTGTFLVNDADTSVTG